MKDDDILKYPSFKALIQERPVDPKEYLKDFYIGNKIKNIYIEGVKGNNLIIHVDLSRFVGFTNDGNPKIANVTSFSLDGGVTKMSITIWETAASPDMRFKYPIREEEDNPFEDIKDYPITPPLDMD